MHKNSCIISYFYRIKALAPEKESERKTNVLQNLYGKYFEKIQIATYGKRKYS